MIESARRWSGYVCPDCRFVFRVPRDHDGQGIVCPSCRRMLRLPGAEDQTAPLLEPMKRTAPAVEPEGEGQVHRKRRRRKGGDLSWEHHQSGKGARHGEQGQMRGFLIGGVVLMALLLGGLAFFLRDQGDAGKARNAPVAGVTPEPAAADREPVVRGDQAVLAEAEPLAGKFLSATRVTELLPLIRHPEISRPRLEKYYPDGKVEAPGLSQFNSSRQVSLVGKLRSITVVTNDYEARQLVVSDAPGAMKVDWESWVGWSEMSWEDFRQTRPTDGRVFRVVLSPVEYYNFAFSDDQRWQSFRLESPDREHAIYGYAEKGSTLSQRLRLNADVKSLPLMLSLKFPEGSTADNQVEIDRFLNEGWVEQDAEP